MTIDMPRHRPHAHRPAVRARVAGRGRIAGAPVLAALAVLLTTGCSAKLTEKSVRDFIDKADDAYVRGRASQMCNMRAKNFTLTATNFNLASGVTVADQAEAEAIEAQHQEEGHVLEGETVTKTLRDFCFDLNFERKTSRRNTMTRGDLSITIDPQAQHATVHAHYTLLEPVYSFDEAPGRARDEVEHQIATRQVEADDDSVVVIEDGELVFASTRATSRSFQIAARRDDSL